MSDAAVSKLRVAIVGNCQISGLAAAARAFLPDAEIKAWHVGVHPKDSDEELLAILPGFDVIISQISDWDSHVPLRISRLREIALPVTYLPGLMFTGFHPDITYIPTLNGFLKGPAGDYHSTIVAAAYVLNVPERRVQALFNNFVFSELGYFEVFESAKASLFSIFDKENYDLRPLFENWIQSVGQFMYSVNHPHIFVLMNLCKAALLKSGIMDINSAPPAEIDDYLSTQYVWPTYPALAYRIGIPGSTTFLRSTSGLSAGEPRELRLTEFITSFFASYSIIDKDILNTGNVATACERLKTIID